MTDRAPRTPERIEEAGAYSAPTGEEVEIPAGSLIVRNGDMVDTQIGKVLIDVPDAEQGEIVFWHNPPHTPDGELHPEQVEGYEPHFDRTGLTRRVLQHITDETDNFALGPRNTVGALGDALLRDPYTSQVTEHALRAAAERESGEAQDEDPFLVDKLAEAEVVKHLERLVNAGLVVQRDDNSFEVTDAGRVELAN